MYSFKTVLLALAFISSLVFTSFAQPPKPARKTRPAAVPAEVRKETVQPVEEDPKTIGLSIERFVNTIDINSDGTGVQVTEELRRFNSGIAIEAFGKYEQLFNKSLEEAEVAEAYILKADGKKVPVGSPGRFIKPTPQAEAAPAFSSLMMIEVKFEGLAIGDAAYVRIVRKTLKPLFGRHFDELILLPAIFDHKNAELNVSAPADYPLHLEAVDLDGGRIADLDGRARWQWRKTDMKALEVEQLMFDLMDASPRLAVTSFKDHEELAAAYWSESRDKSTVTPAVRKLADEITAGITEPSQQAYAMYDWVNKNIRYLLIVLDRGGWIPNSTDQILANGYGDCKDYTNLLHALLAAKGIESHPVLIRSDMGTWFPKVAVPAFFNHAVLYIPSLDLFADATAPNTRLGLIPQSIVGKKALLAGEKPGLISTPVDRPGDNQLISSVDIAFDRAGGLRSVSKTTFKGRTEILFRPLFSDPDLRSRSEAFVKAMLLFHGLDGTGKILSMGNPFKPDQPFDIEVEAEIKDYTTFMPNGSFSIPIGTNLMNIFELEQYVKAGTRRTNLMLGASIFEETFVVTLPDGVVIEKVRPAVEFSNAVGSFANRLTIDGQKLTISRSLLISKDIIPPSEYAQARELIEKATVEFGALIPYKADVGLLAAKARQVKTAKPKQLLTIEEQLMASLPGYGSDDKPLTGAEVRRLETKLARNPNDAETRSLLASHYQRPGPKDTPARIAQRKKHRLWFIRNRPDMEYFEYSTVFSLFGDLDASELPELKAAWIEAVGAHASEPRVRLNAAEFMREKDPVTAESLLVKGAELFPDDYRFMLELSKIYRRRAQLIAMVDVEASAAVRARELEAGEAALKLLKRERSESRDADRRSLLLSLSGTALEAGKPDTAKALATELILDFGQNAASPIFDDAVHTGNIVLGRVALKAGDVEKAKEHLLIAIKAPLRMEKSWLADIDVDLARELLAIGEKDVVLEYLKLSEGLSNLQNEPELFAEKLKAIRLWQVQIKEGKTPTFDVYAK